MGFSQLQNKVKEKEKGGLLVNIEDGDNELRILPNKYEPLVFKEAWVYYGGKGSITNMTIFSPLSWGEPDPVMEFVKEQTNGVRLPQDEYFRIINLAPKPVYLVPVVKRGKEKDGVKWLSLSGGKYYHGDHEPEGQFGKVMDNYKSVFRKALKRGEDVDVTDVEAGYDLLVKRIPKEQTDNDFGEIRYQFDHTPVHVLPPELQDTEEGEELLDELLNKQPHWEKIYPRKTSAEVEEMFDKYTQGLEDIDDSEMDTDVDDDDVETVTYGEEEDYDTDEIIANAEKVFGGDDEEEESEEEEKPKKKKSKSTTSKKKSVDVEDEELVEDFDEDDF